MKRNVRGFTLVEILIVVIILGILAAIVIPQFTNASSDAQRSSIQTTLQTIRGQIELFKIQHGDSVPDFVGGGWDMMTGKTNSADLTASNAAGTFGPYLQNAPANPANGLTGITNDTGAAFGWHWNTTLNMMSALSTDGSTWLTY